MKQITLKLKSGIPFELHAKGRFVHYLQGDFPLQISAETIAGDNLQSTALLSNVGAELKPFDRILITSEYDQNVIFATSMMQIFDNRLGVASGVQIQTAEAGTKSFVPKRLTLGAGVVELLPEDLRRRSVVIDTDKAIKVFNSLDGGDNYFEVDGVLDHECQSAIYVSGEGANIQLLEYLN